MADTTFNNVRLLLPFNGANGGTTINECAAGQTFTTANVTTSTTQSKFYGSSGSFNGTNSYMTFGYTAESRLGSSNFTFRAWVYPTNLTGTHTIIDARGIAGDYANTWAFGLSGSNFRLVVSTSASGVNGAWSINSTGTVALTLNAWNHVQVCRSGSNWYTFVNGTLDISTTSAITVGTEGLGVIGAGCNGVGTLGYFFSGYMQDLELRIGEALNTSTFTPPTSSLCKTISGIVKDDTNTGVVRTIYTTTRLRQAAIRTTTSASDGTYSLTVGNTPQTIIFLDDDAGTQYNSLILDRVTPL